MPCIIVETAGDVAAPGWVRSYVAADGSRTICEFEAADVATIIALHRAHGVEPERAWESFKHEASTSVTYARSEAAKVALPGVTVIVVTDFDPPISDATNQAMGERVFSCLAAQHASWVRTYLSIDRRRMVCNFEGPDADTVRLILHMSKTEFGRAFRADLREG